MEDWQEKHSFTVLHRQKSQFYAEMTVTGGGAGRNNLFAFGSSMAPQCKLGEGCDALEYINKENNDRRRLQEMFHLHPLHTGYLGEAHRARRLREQSPWFPELKPPEKALTLAAPEDHRRQLYHNDEVDHKCMGFIVIDADGPDTDGDGLEDGWEVANGLDPLDSGEPDDRDIENTNADGEDAGEQNETFPDPDNGPYGDPDRDGLTNEQEAAIGTNPTASDSDGDGLNDRWESLYTETVQTPQGPVTLLDPLNPNWGCPLLTPQVEAEMQVIIGTSTWNSLPVGPNGDHSCDSVLDIDRQGPDLSLIHI